MTKTADSEVSKRGEEDELLCGGEDGELERFFLFLSWLSGSVEGFGWREGWQVFLEWKGLGELELS